jgi:hypothetical protein
MSAGKVLASATRSPPSRTSRARPESISAPRGLSARSAQVAGAFDITGRGEIVGTGMVNFGTESPDFDVPITGGTGGFANVRGVAHVHLTENGETDTLELLP